MYYWRVSNNSTGVCARTAGAGSRVYSAERAEPTIKDVLYVHKKRRISCCVLIHTSIQKFDDSLNISNFRRSIISIFLIFRTEEGRCLTISHVFHLLCYPLSLFRIILKSYFDSMVRSSTEIQIILKESSISLMQWQKFKKKNYLSNIDASTAETTVVNEIRMCELIGA